MYTDVLVIGSGGAACSTALSLAKAGMNVVMISRTREPEDSCTSLAQGGIIYRGEEDSEEQFVKDFQKAGGHLNNPKSLKTLYSYGSELVDEVMISDIAVPFDRNDKGELHVTLEAAHSMARILHVEDLTGKAIIESYISKLKQYDNLKMLCNTTAIDLLTIGHHSLNKLDIYKRRTCFGAFVLMRDMKKVIPIFAKYTVIATGGLGRCFINTTNPVGTRGDGYAFAYRAQARIINMEYIQFHPTAFYHEHADRFLITEAVRGEGGVLINKKSEEFMDKYHPDGSLAPRDVVARGIHKELIRTESSCVYLDITHRDSDWLRSRFPNIYEKCLKHNIDITKDPIPVVPAAHYSCGGIWVNQKGNTSIKRLKAVGEVACNGLHGANRLASSSLLECLVFGTLAAKDIIEHISKKEYYFPEIKPWESRYEAVDQDLINQDWLTLQHTMWNYVGIVRTEKRLRRAVSILSHLKDDIDEFYSYSELSDELIGLRNAIQTSLLVLYSAKRNKTSLGCHYRQD